MSNTRDTVIAGITVSAAIGAWSVSPLLEYADIVEVYWGGQFLAVGAGYCFATFRNKKSIVIDIAFALVTLGGAASFLIPAFSDAVKTKHRQELACMVVESQLFELHPVAQNMPDLFSALKCHLRRDDDHIKMITDAIKEMNENTAKLRADIERKRDSKPNPVLPPDKPSAPRP